MGLTFRFNARQLEANLSNVGKQAMANGARSLGRIANRMQKLAKEYAPVDDGDLQEAIKIDKVGRDVNNRVAYTVYVDGNAPASTDEEGGVTKRVGDYALLQEKYLTPAGRWQLGPRSEEKKAAGNDVGGRFMERAAKEAAERAQQDLGDDLRAFLKKSKTSRGIGGRIMSRSDYRSQRGDDGDDE